MMPNWDQFDNNRPVLIAGPTASGKSELGLQIAQRFGGQIVNADSLQIYSGWDVLTACPPADDLARAAHHLYRYVDNTTPYSVGAWLRDVDRVLPCLTRPIFVGGTGLFFRALTEGLAEIPPTPDHIRATADAILAEHGTQPLLDDLSDAVKLSIDCNNPKRIQRAWEVWKTTGRDITDWQAETPPPLIPIDQAIPIVMMPDVDWLNDRIARRFHIMIDQGALSEVEGNLPDWDPTRTSSQAIGAKELVSYLRGDCDLDTAIEHAVIATRQYAKRQRTWFRKRMKHWTAIDPSQRS